MTGRLLLHTHAHAHAHTHAHTHAQPVLPGTPHTKFAARVGDSSRAREGGGVAYNTARILPANFLGKGRLMQEKSEVRQKPRVSEKRNCQRPKRNEKRLAALVARETQSDRIMLCCSPPAQLASSGRWWSVPCLEKWRGSRDEGDQGPLPGHPGNF